MSDDEPLIRVGVAEWSALEGPGTLVTSGLGSCVAIAVYDSETATGALLHAMLPESSEDVDKPAKYVDTGIHEVLDELESRGANRANINAKVAGGSSMLDISVGETVGERNVEATKQALDEADVPLVATETGGNAGRSVSFCPASGDVTIDRVDAEVHVI